MPRQQVTVIRTWRDWANERIDGIIPADAINVTIEVTRDRTGQIAVHLFWGAYDEDGEAAPPPPTQEVEVPT